MTANVRPQVAPRVGQRTIRSSAQAPLKYPPMANKVLMKGFVGAVRSFFTTLVFVVFLGTFDGADDDALMRVTLGAVATIAFLFLFLPNKIACSADCQD